MKSPLHRLFNYINISILPNINLYNVTNNTVTLQDYGILKFGSSHVKEYLWFYKERKRYYALLELKNGKYMYLHGHMKYEDVKFKMYHGSHKDDVIKCMKPHVKTWYLEDISDISD